MSVTVKPGNTVLHDGVEYVAGKVITAIKDVEAEALLVAGVVEAAVEGGVKAGEEKAHEEAQTQTQPTPEEIAAAAAAAGGTQVV